MRKIKNEEEKRIRITLSISQDLNKMIIENTSNKSRYIEFALLEYFKKCGLDTSKIKL